MMPATKPLAVVKQVAILILVREFGLVDTARFLNQYSGGYGNYTAERELLFAHLTFDEIVNEIKAARPPADS